ncbi:MAG: hypothetical protein ABIT05_09910 [Chitinophagaceae bacterium]
MKKGIIFAFLLLPVLGFCQEYLNRTHAVVMSDLQKHKKEKTILAGADSLIRVTTKGKDGNSVSYIYRFDKSGKCISERVTTACESCYKNLLQAQLKTGKYGWTKINENQYVSKFEDKMTIELPVEKDEYFFTIMRTDWSRTLYDLLIKK